MSDSVYLILATALKISHRAVFSYVRCCTVLWLWIEKRLMEVICTIYKNHKLSLTETFTFTKDKRFKFTNHFKLAEFGFETETETESDRRVKQMIL